jgi:hypothetical protein
MTIDVSFPLYDRVALLVIILTVLDGVNTEAAERCFSWLEGYASILSCLGWRRSPLFLPTLFHTKNLERTKVRPTRVFQIVSDNREML